MVVRGVLTPGQFRYLLGAKLLARYRVEKKSAKAVEGFNTQTSTAYQSPKATTREMVNMSTTFSIVILSEDVTTKEALYVKKPKEWREWSIPWHSKD